MFSFVVASLFFNILLFNTTPATAKEDPETVVIEQPESKQTVSQGSLMDEAVQKAVVTQEFRGAVMAVEDGKVLLRKGYGPGITYKTRFLIGSLTKQFTGVAILHLIDEGKLSFDDTLGSLLPAAILDPTWKKITVRQLLLLQTGLPDYAPEKSDFQRKKPFLPTEILQSLKNKPLAFPPGTKNQYNSTAYLLLGLIIEAKSGMSYADYLQTTFFKPLGMTSTAYNPQVNVEEVTSGSFIHEGENRKGFDNLSVHISKAFSAGGIYSTVEDLYKWSRALSNDKFLSLKMRKEILDTPSMKVFGMGISVIFNAGFIIKKPPPHLTFTGEILGFNSKMAYFLDSEDFLVVLCSNDEMTKNAKGRKIYLSESVFNTLLPILHPKKHVNSSN